MGGVAVVLEVQEGPLVSYKVAKPTKTGHDEATIYTVTHARTQHPHRHIYTHTHTHSPSFTIAAPSVLVTVLVYLQLCRCFL